MHRYEAEKFKTRTIRDALNTRCVHQGKTNEKEKEVDYKIEMALYLILIAH